MVSVIKSSNERSRCVSQPISWLKLEQYHTGDLQEKHQQDIAGHLSVCTSCNGKYQQIVLDNRPLRPLSIEADPKTRYALMSSFAWGFGATAAIAALVFILFIPKSDIPGSFPKHRIIYKGGDVVLSLARERQGRVVQDPKTYRDGDRFRLFLTSPKLGPISVDVAVFQEDKVFFPYPNRQNIMSGNRVPLAGAFRVTGDITTTICVLLGHQLPHRDLISSSKSEALSQNTVCHTLEPGSAE